MRSSAGRRASISPSFAPIVQRLIDELGSDRGDEVVLGVLPPLLDHLPAVGVIEVHHVRLRLLDAAAEGAFAGEEHGVEGLEEYLETKAILGYEGRYVGTAEHVQTGSMLVAASGKGEAKPLV